MIIEVNQIDKTGKQHDRKFTMSRPAFIKHLAVAGQGYAPVPQKLLRTVGMLLHYNLYIRKAEFDDHRFSEPPRGLSDPTEKGQFSNLAGKAIADFLSKKIDTSLYTVNYEAAMRLHNHKLKGIRPDLLAFTQDAVFAIEAKGRSQKDPGKMAVHKMQSASGPVAVNYSVACVSYNLFDRIKCNYHDPVIDNSPYDSTALAALTKNYYDGLTRFLDERYFRQNIIKIQGEEFYQVELNGRRLSEKVFGRHSFWDFEILELFRPCLILPANIRHYAADGISRDTKPFLFLNNGEQEYLYIDNDRVGLRLRR